jgi:CspA family cold shock protein
MRGFVKWFDDRKGYGFLSSFESNEDVFVHHTAIQMDGRRTLYENQEVVYDVELSQKGPNAINVVPKEN